MGKRSIYFYSFTTRHNSKEVKGKFKEFVSNNTLQQSGEESSYTGFLINAMTKEPLIDEFSSHLEVEYGVEQRVEVRRLNGAKEIYHIPRKTTIILDFDNKIIGIYTSRENVANDLFEKIQNEFTSPHEIQLSKIMYESDYLHWLANNAVQHSEIITKMDRVRVENDEETGVISHEDGIGESILYKIVDNWKSFEFIEGKMYIKNKPVGQSHIIFRVYASGKITITHPEPYTMAKMVYRELEDLKQKVEHSTNTSSVNEQ